MNNSEPQQHILSDSKHHTQRCQSHNIFIFILIFKFTLGLDKKHSKLAVMHVSEQIEVIS